MRNLPRVLIVLGILLLILGFALLQVPKEAAVVPEPAPAAEAGWEVYADDSLALRYPRELSWAYITPVAWPPKSMVSEGGTPCVPGTSEAGETREALVLDRAYCLTSHSEGAAGSIYTDFVYRAQKEGKTVTLSFTLRLVQCANYDEPQVSECEYERMSFNPDVLADQIFQTVELR